eukprot:TRINITY_DN4146_c0_g3_i1.p2 TRINITY_DN4146_c0_g3~~TRINITY_DN4146_c0_g3_i1.p2  ORF type:complete len:245 (+),score=35.13 TRINITY_DN4146_c0_g3_i1:42-776(+)
MNTTFTPIADAIKLFSQGNILIVMDDEDRENEGDLIMAAEWATPEKVAFFIRYTTGILCTPLSPAKAAHLELPLMVSNATDPRSTAFTVTVDHKNAGTGVSAANRTMTIKALASPISTASDFTRPGHIFPLIARSGGVLERRGHTEATYDLCRLAGVECVGLIGELTNDDGTMKRLKDCIEFGKQHSLPIITIEDLANFIRKVGLYLRGFSPTLKLFLGIGSERKFYPSVISRISNGMHSAYRS